MVNLQWLWSVLINGFFMLLVCLINKKSNDKRDEFEKLKYKDQVNKKSKEFLSKYYIGLDSTNFIEDCLMNNDKNNFEKNNSQLILKGSLRDIIIRIITDYNNKNYYTNCITQHDYNVVNSKGVGKVYNELFLLSNDERNEVLRLLQEEMPKKEIDFK